MVSINLDRSKRRPAILLNTASEDDMLCLLDTGALISVWCQRKFLFLRHFPDAVKTNYVTTVSGFGGVSLQKREIWKIPEFVLKDSHGDEMYTVKNLLVALVDNNRIMSFKMILSATVFRGSSYHVFDEDSDDKRIEIYPKYNREAVCVASDVVDSNELKDIMPDDYDILPDEIFINGSTVFFNES